MAKLDKQFLTNLVYDRVRTLIDDGTLPAGQKVNRVELSKQLGVSQTPINDALSRLVGERLVEQRSSQGYFVTLYTYAELVPIYELRAALEGMALRLCVERNTPEQMGTLIHAFDQFELPVPDERHADYLHADTQFHHSIMELSGNRILLEMAKTSAFLTKSNIRGLVRPPNETLPEHRTIITAVFAADAGGPELSSAPAALPDRDGWKRQTGRKLRDRAAPAVIASNNHFGIMRRVGAVTGQPRRQAGYDAVPLPGSRRSVRSRFGTVAAWRIFLHLSGSLLPSASVIPWASSRWRAGAGRAFHAGEGIGGLPRRSSVVGLLERGR
jgi:DNA-binding GntR family transcriptional regulator